MTNKELLRAIGFDDRTITIGLDNEYAQMMLEKKIDSYLKKLDEEKKKEDMIEQLKHGQYGRAIQNYPKYNKKRDKNYF